jgi:predicted phage tail protein
MLAVTDGKTSVRSILLSSGIDPYQPITVQLDGELLEVEQWDLICPEQGQMLNVHGTVQGGGGESNVVMIVAMIAIAVAAPYAGAALAGAAGLTGTALAVGTAVFTAAVQIAGSLIIGALFAPKPQTMPNAPAAVSPTYSLSGGSNRARPYEPMPAVLGEHRLFLDYGARPFTEYRGNDQYLYQIFNLGLGNISATDYKIGTTALSSYDDAELITADANGRLPNFPSNVDSTAGAALTETAGYVTRTTSIDTYQIGIDLETVIFFANNKGDLEARSVELEIEFKLASSATFVNPSALEIFGDNFTYSAGIITATGSSQKPNRATLYIKDLTPDTYDVRIRRLTADSEDSKLQSQTNWSTLRSYQLDDADYKGQNRIGLIIRATEQLNGAVQQFSATVTAQATYWNGTAFVTGVTSNPAHWFTHFARGVRNSDGKLMYGVGLADNQLDLAALAVWANFCSTEGLTFNGVIDTNLTAADILNSIGVTGFGSPTWASGKLGVVFDSRNASPVMTFGMSNIIRDSFEVAYISENLAEEIVVRFSDPTRDYEQNEVRTLAPDVVTPTRTSSIDLYGCTSETMAGKFANYVAAQQYYRRRRVTWQSDFEGFVCQRGDVVLVSHDLTQWGYSGRFVATNNNVVTLDRAVPRQNQVEYLMLIRPDGTTTVYDVAASTDEESDTLTIVDDFFTLQAGADLIDHRWTFSPLQTPGKKLKILSVAPASDSRLQIVATDEPSEFYDAWNGTFVAPPIETVLPAQPVTVTNLTLTNRVAFTNGFLTNRVSVSWRVGGGTLYSQVQVYLNGSLLTESAQLRVPYFELDINAVGSLLVEVTPFGLTGAGLTQTATLNIAELGFPEPPETVTLEVGENGRNATFAWTPVLGVQSYVIEVFSGGSVRRTVNVGNTLSYVYSVADAIADGGPFRSYDLRVYSVNQTGQSTTFTAASFLNPQIGQLQNASVEPMPNSIWFKCDTPAADDFAAIKVWISKTQGFTVSDAVLSYEGSDTFVTISADADGNPLESGVVYYVRAAGYDTFGDDNLTLTAELSATILSPAWGLLQDDIETAMLESGLRDRIDKIEVNETAIATEQTVRADADSALAQQITTVSASVDGNTAAIQTEATTRANADSALASNITTLQSTVNGNTTSIQTTATTVDGIQGKYSVKIDNNGYVSGFGLISTANNAVPFADFQMIADRFAIAPVASNPDAVDGSPFFVLTAPQTINGVTVAAGTYMKQAFIYDAVITTAKIDSLAVTNAKIANAAINAAKIEDATITTAKIGDAQITDAKIANATITNAKIATLDAGKINTGTLSADRIAAGSITAAKIDSRNLTIRDSSNNIIFSASQNLDWNRVANQPSNIFNSNVAINANGTLTGAGGGQVSLGGLGAGAFATLSQINSSNISTYIASAAIGTAFIQNAAITNALIANAAISTAKIADLAVGNAKIANGAVSQAKIEDATISTAKIGIAQIDTLRVAGNAVTTQGSVSRATSGTSSFTINSSTGGTILIIANARASSAANNSVNVFVNGVLQLTVSGNQVLVGAESFEYVSATAMALVNVAAGTHTITGSQAIGTTNGFVLTGLLTQR